MKSRLLFQIFFLAQILACSTDEGQERKPIGSKRITGQGPTGGPTPTDQTKEEEEKETPTDESSENTLCKEAQSEKVPIGEDNKRPACLVMENWVSKRLIIDPDKEFENDPDYSGYCFEFTFWVSSSIYKIATDQGKTLLSGNGESCVVFEYEVEKASGSCAIGDYMLELECESLVKNYCFSTTVSGVESLLEPLDGTTKIIKDNLTCKQ